ncbi:GNAT family N-acetyltransferase [Pontibacter saemangeumensis]|uniref:GNAT family N-acetyltransferase n=1 Tax=Pontibacter saemangeumensis TaxID=1084525 RepID=A0ABP8LX24_9BACT
MRSERLVLEKFREEDFGNYYRLAGNELVMRMVTGNALSQQEAEEKYKQILAVNLSQEELGYFAVKTIAANSCIGLGKIVLTDPEEAEIGYLLLPESWGKGYGGEIARLLVKHAQGLPYLRTLSAIIDPANTASKRILEKLDFKLFYAGALDNLPAELYKRPL